MRVLVVTSGYLSGHGNFVAEQVRSLRDADVEMEVIFFDPRDTRLNYGLSLPRITHAIGSNRYDIVHTHHTYTMILVDLAKKLTGTVVPVVLTSHEPEILDRKGRTRTWHPSSHLRHSLRLKRFAANRADFVIFVFRQLASVLAIERPHDVIPCGIDLSKFRPLNRGECRRQLGLPTDSLVIFFPAHPRRVIKRFELARQVYELVRREFPEALLITGGGIQLDTMPLYYGAADVMLQTSICEASPSAVKEALACELPVVSTDAGDTREIIQGMPHCWICSEDAEEIANRVLDAKGHRAQGGRERMFERALSLEQVARRVIGVYERVLGRQVSFGAI
jgi:glycosyltransferase involved in cell wall biosynthesis